MVLERPVLVWSGPVHRSYVVLRTRPLSTTCINNDVGLYVPVLLSTGLCLFPRLISTYLVDTHSRSSLPIQSLSLASRVSDGLINICHLNLTQNGKAPRRWLGNIFLQTLDI